MKNYTEGNYRHTTSFYRRVALGIFRPRMLVENENLHSVLQKVECRGENRSYNALYSFFEIIKLENPLAKVSF